LVIISIPPQDRKNPGIITVSHLASGQ
jgi:hypothetical protein